LSYLDPEYAALINVIATGETPLLIVFRDGIVRFAGELMGINETVNEAGSQVTVVFGNPLARLMGDSDNTGRFTDVGVTFTQIDQGAILWSLVDTANSIADTRIRLGTIEPTKLRDRIYDYKNIGAAFKEMAAVLDGPDFEFAPLDPLENDGKLAELNVMNHQGVDQLNAIFGYGPDTLANVNGYAREWRPPINRVRTISTEGLAALKTLPSSITQFGVWEMIESLSDGTVEQATADERALDLLRSGWTRVVSFTPESDIAPQPFDDYGIGDTVSLNIRDGAAVEELSARMNGITVTLDADDNETHELVTEAGE
jgi:hypothetical protein